MIHYTYDSTLEIEGTGSEILAEVGIISVNIIQQMVEIGIPKSYAITIFYKALECSIKVYEREGEL